MPRKPTGNPVGPPKKQIDWLKQCEKLEETRRAHAAARESLRAASAGDRSPHSDSPSTSGRPIWGSMPGREEGVSPSRSRAENRNSLTE